MIVWYVHEVKNEDGKVFVTANIFWKGKWPVQAGYVFPPDHPCMADPNGMTQFRSKGYGASPFPEGDGVTLAAMNDRSAEQVIADIKECFAWEVQAGFPR